MQIKSIILLVILLATFAAMADDEDIRASYPYAVLSNDTIDMGTIESGSRATGYIRLRNEGTPDLLIAKVRSSCGLMIPTWPTEAIRKEEEVTITFRYNTNRIGPFTRNIIIHTNSYQKTLIVPVYGEVIP